MDSLNDSIAVFTDYLAARVAADAAMPKRTKHHRPYVKPSGYHSRLLGRDAWLVRAYPNFTLLINGTMHDCSQPQTACLTARERISNARAISPGEQPARAGESSMFFSPIPNSESAIWAEFNARVKKSAEALAYYRQAEIDARATLNRATDSVRIAKEKHEKLFTVEQGIILKRLKAL